MNFASKTNGGHGAGGINTNKNGLSYENLTDLNNCYTIIESNKYSDTIMFNQNNTIFIRSEKANFKKYLSDKIDNNVKELHGTKQPDEVYINETEKLIFIIEKKFQQVSGSKCECLQTAEKKKRKWI